MRLEVCVDDAAGLAEAVAGGADRVELCAALGLGGLTPAPGLMEVAAGVGAPVWPMIRARPGNFVFDRADVAVMKADIRAALGFGLPGVVLGACGADGRLDRVVLEDLLAEAQGMGVALHRVIDLAPDVEEAVEVAVALGFRRILSSGGAAKAHLGVGRLRRMVAVAAGRIAIMPGSGVTPETWPLLAGLGVGEVHASCAAPIGWAGDALGFATGAERRTDRRLVAAMKAALGASGGEQGQIGG
jgi:copper homeostasis protein